MAKKLPKTTTFLFVNETFLRRRHGSQVPCIYRASWTLLSKNLIPKIIWEQIRDADLFSNDNLENEG